MYDGRAAAAAAKAAGAAPAAAAAAAAPAARGGRAGTPWREALASVSSWRATETQAGVRGGVQRATDPSRTAAPTRSRSTPLPLPPPAA